jgi:hypothetical protein
MVADELGVLPQGVKPADEPPAGELLRFGADWGVSEIVRISFGHIDCSSAWPALVCVLASRLPFWHYISGLYADNKDFDREGYLACFRHILKACDANISRRIRAGPLCTISQQWEIGLQKK